MPPRRSVGRPRTARVARDAGDEHVPPADLQNVVQPVDQDALRQMVQDAARQAAQEAVQQVAQEAARQAAQAAALEVARQMGATQHGPHGPQVQERQGPQIPVQQPHVPQFPGVYQVPPPPPPLPVQAPEVNEQLLRVLEQLRYVDLEKFGGTVDPIVAHDWRHRLSTCLETIDCPLRLCLNVAVLYLRGDAAAWWDGIRRLYTGELTFEFFLHEFDRKYFPRETLHQQKNDFEHLRQGSRTVREYELEFSRLRRFAGDGMLEEDLIRRFLDGMRVDLRGRCSVVTYTRLEDLVEKAAMQEACIAEEQKYSRTAHPRTSGTSDSLKRPLDHPGTVYCVRCHRRHFGKCLQCFNCRKFGHLTRNCQSRPSGDQRAPPPPPVARAVPAVAPFAPGACYNCGQFGHIARICPTRGPPAKRPAIAPRVHALGGIDGAEPIAGDTDDQD